MSSTLLTEDTGVPFDELQAEQIRMFREASGCSRARLRAEDFRQPQRDPDCGRHR